MHVGSLVDEREVGAELVADRGLEDALEHVAMCLQVRLGRPDVEPVAGERDPVDRALRREPREHLALDRDAAFRRHELEHLRLEHVEPGVDEVGVDLLGPRLLEEGLDATVRGGADEPVPARVGDRCEQDCRLGAGRAMERDQLAEVGLAERVAVEREEALFELAACEADRAAGSERLVLDRVRERHPSWLLPNVDSIWSGR